MQHISYKVHCSQQEQRRRLCSADDAAEGRHLAQIFHQVCNVVQMLSQHGFLLPCRSCALILLLTHRSLSFATPATTGAAQQLAGTVMQPSSVRASWDAGRRSLRIRGRLDRRFGQQVKVEELEQATLDLAAGTARLEQCGDRQQTIEAFERSCVIGGTIQRYDEREKGSALNCGAVCWVDEVEQKLSLEVDQSDGRQMELASGGEGSKGFRSSRSYAFPARRCACSADEGATVLASSPARSISTNRSAHRHPLPLVDRVLPPAVMPHSIQNPPAA
jgi:hypothetical protein